MYYKFKPEDAFDFARYVGEPARQHGDELKSQGSVRIVTVEIKRTRTLFPSICQPVSLNV